MIVIDVKFATFTFGSARFVFDHDNYSGNCFTAKSDFFVAGRRLERSLFAEGRH